MSCEIYMLPNPHCRSIPFDDVRRRRYKARAINIGYKFSPTFGHVFGLDKASDRSPLCSWAWSDCISFTDKFASFNCFFALTSIKKYPVASNLVNSIHYNVPVAEGDRHVSLLPVVHSFWTGKALDLKNPPCMNMSSLHPGRWKNALDHIAVCKDG